MQEMKKFFWSRLFRTVVALTMVMALLLCCGCSKKDDDPTEPQQTTKPNVLGDGDGKLEAQDAVDGFTKIYGTLLGAMGGQTAASMGTEMDITLALGDDILSYLSSMMESNGLPSDVSWLQQIGLGMDMTYSGDLMQTGMELSLGETSVISANMIMDMLGGMVYMGVPQLNDQYLAGSVNFSDAVGSYESMMGQMEAYADIVGSLPTETQLNTLLTRYLNLMLDKLEEPVVSEVTLTHGSVSQKVTATTHTIRAMQLLEMVEAVLTAAQTDAELEKMLDAISKYINEQGAKDAAAGGYTWYDQDLHQELMEAIPDALEELEGAKESMEDSDYLTFTIYATAKEQVGFRFFLADQYDSYQIYAYSLVEDDQTAFEMNIADQIRFEGTGTLKSNKANGTYKLYAEEMEILTLEVKDFDKKALDKGELDGTLRLSLSNEAIEQAIGPNAFFTSATVLEIVLKTEGANASIAYNLYSGSAFIVGISVRSRIVAAGEIRVPADYADLTKNDELQQWIGDADFQKVLQNLRKAGVPEELVAMLESSLGI